MALLNNPSSWVRGSALVIIVWTQFKGSTPFSPQMSSMTRSIWVHPWVHTALDLLVPLSSQTFAHQLITNLINGDEGDARTIGWLTCYLADLWRALKGSSSSITNRKISMQWCCYSIVLPKQLPLQREGLPHLSALRGIDLIWFGGSKQQKPAFWHGLSVSGANGRSDGSLLRRVFLT